MPLSPKDASGQPVHSGGATGSVLNNVEDVGLGTPRLIYIDVDDDLPVLLDRVEEAPAPAILVLPDNARAVHGAVAARLLKRRAQAAGIGVAAVATDRATVSHLQGAGVSCFATVGEARKALAEGLAHPHALLSTAPSKGVAEAQAPVLASPGDPATIVPGHDLATRPPGLHESAAVGDVIDLAERNSEHAGYHASPAFVSHGHRSGAGSLDTGTALGGEAASEDPGNGARAVPEVDRRRPWVRIAALPLLVLCAAGLGWVWLFPFATVSIVFTPRPFDRTYQVTVGSTALDELPLYHTHTTQSLSAQIVGTGTLLIPDLRATGTIAFANPLSGVVIVPAGTALAARDGLRFATTEAVNVPGAVQNFSGTTNGQALAPIEALLGGTASNVPAGAITAIEGRLAGVLLVTNPSGLSGGTSKIVYTITQQDETAAIDAARAKLAAAEVSWLNQEYSQSPLRTVERTRQTAFSETRSSQGGRPYARVSITLTTDMAYLHAEDIRAAGLRKARGDLNRTGQLLIGSVASVKVLQAAGTIPAQIAMRVQGRTMPALDLGSLAARIAGTTVTDALTILDDTGKPAGWHATISTDPSWANRLPITSRLISIHMVQ